MAENKIVITGGGTGGHVFPAVSIAQELQKRGVVVHYIGSATGFEAKIVPSRQIPFHAIRSGAVKNQGVQKVLSSLLKVCWGYFHSLWLLVRLKPKAVIGVGGYVSVPVCLAAVTLRIPLFIQEQNVSVGIANQLLGRFAVEVFLGFEQAKKSFPKTQSLLTGNPVRPEFFSVGESYDSSPKELLILGGSQGANAINAAIVSNLDRICETFPNLKITHQTGERDCETVKHAYQDIMDRGQFEVVPFIDDILPRYQRACLVIARAGALTVSEILCVRRPTIFVPYPRKGQNDQTDNANYLQRLGVAISIEQGENFKERLWMSLQQCLNSEKLSEMYKMFSNLRPTNALATICDRVLRG